MREIITNFLLTSASRGWWRYHERASGVASAGRQVGGSESIHDRNSDTLPLSSMEEARKILRSSFGLSEFRGQQEACIERLVVGGKNALAIMPTGQSSSSRPLFTYANTLVTGSGKSLCYQLPALMFPGLTLVISPLIALMKVHKWLGTLQQTVNLASGPSRFSRAQGTKSWPL